MSFWEQCLTQLASIINQQDFERWIATLVCINWDEKNKTLILGHKTLQAIETIEKNFSPAIASVASSIAHDAVTVQYHQTEGRVDYPQEALPLVPEDNVSSSGASAASNNAYACGLLEQQSFENFVAGSSNQLAYVAAKSVGDNPGKNYNPLFIYGGVGLGKTHLMHAVGNQMLKNNPNARVLCVGTQTFINDFTTAVRENNYAPFDHKYQNLDALFIDDIQYLGGKRQIQQKLFEIFEKLVPHGKQIIFTSDTYARSLKDMDERLISRFTSGLSVEVEPPELETRVAILQKKSLAQHFDLPDDVAYFIARHLKSNVRELEGALNCVIAYTRFSNEEKLTLEKAREALQQIEEKKYDTELTTERRYTTILHYGMAFCKKRCKVLVQTVNLS